MGRGAAGGVITGLAETGDMVMHLLRTAMVSPMTRLRGCMRSGAAARKAKSDVQHLLFLEAVRAISDGNLAALRSVAARGLDLNEPRNPNPDPEDPIPLPRMLFELAASMQQESACALLLELGARWGAGFTGSTCLHHALHSETMMRMMLGAGGRRIPRYMLDQTLWSWAYERRPGDAGALGALLEAGADPNARWEGGWGSFQARPTAFCVAAMRFDPHRLKLLAGAGADPRLTDADGNTAIHYVICDEAPGYIDPVSNTLAGVPGEDGVRATVECLRGLGVPLNAVNHKGETVLHRAARERAPIPQSIAVLGEDSDLTARNAEGLTCVELAERTGNRRFVEAAGYWAVRQAASQARRALSAAAATPQTSGDAA